MKLEFVAVTVALWCGTTAAFAVPQPNSGLHVELAGAPSTENVGAFLKRSTDAAEAAGVSVRDSNPELHDMLLGASHAETVHSFVKRTCPGGNSNTCCPYGQFRVDFTKNKAFADFLLIAISVPICW